MCTSPFAMFGTFILNFLISYDQNNQKIKNIHTKKSMQRVISHGQNNQISKTVHQSVTHNKRVNLNSNTPILYICYSKTQMAP